MPKLRCVLLASMALLCTQAPAVELKLHVPSPDWREQIVYFVLLDRFADGDPANNDQGAGEYDPGDSRRYSGGDLKGLIAQLDYIQGLGATAVWITPPNAHQWWDRQREYGGYHGYWPEHFAEVDPHFGTLDDYRALSDALHRRGMYLIQDIVVNHTGNYFDVARLAEDPAQAGFVRHRQPPGERFAPRQWPFSENDLLDPRQRELGVYHRAPDIVDFSDPVAIQSGQMAGLDDLNTDNPLVRRALRQSYGHWIREVGVDAYRVDTAFYVAPDFFADFMDAKDAAAPGLRAVAASTGRDQFLAFGEGFAIDPPLRDESALRIEGYMHAADGSARLPGMLNFPLYGTLLDVYARGRPTADLAFRIESMQRRHPRLALMPSFVDNHDVDRFLAGGSEAGLRQALLTLMSLPGIPVIYYGTEQGFRAQRASMFAAGYGSGGRSHFDREAPLYRYLARVSALRREHPVLAKGQVQVLASSSAGPGAIAWRVDDGNTRRLVLINSADTPRLLADLDVDVAAGSELAGVFAIAGEPPALRADAGGHLSIELPPRSGYVYALPASPAQSALSMAALPDPVSSEQLAISGRAPAGSRLQWVLDGALREGQHIEVDGDGRWQASLDLGELYDPQVLHELVLRDAGTGASLRRHFRVARSWQPWLSVEDPAGDDHGPSTALRSQPSGAPAEVRYRYPGDPSWGSNRQLDLRRIEVSRAGRALKLDLGMPTLTQYWNPPNGFDHVAFFVYVEVPGRPGGLRVMPQQNAELPAGMRWHYRLRAHGWSNVWTASDGADAEHEGTPVQPGLRLIADPAQQRVSIVISPAALGGIESLEGVRLFISTWDYDGRMRPLRPTGDGMSFGGGDASRDPLVMDDSGVIELRDR